MLAKLEKSYGVQSENAPLSSKSRGISKSASPGSKASRARSRAHSLSARHNGRSLRCRPRPQQGPRGLHRQGRQHQLHDGVAAPRQQVRLPARPARASPSNETMLVLEVRLFQDRGSRRVGDAIAPHCADSARRDAPIASSDQTSIDRRRVIARSRARLARRAVSGPETRCFSFCRPLLSARGLIRSRARARAFERAARGRLSRRAVRGRNKPGRSSAAPAARMSETTARRLHARGVPRSSRFRVSERRLDEGRSCFPVRDRAVPANANRVSIDPRMRR